MNNIKMVNSTDVLFFHLKEVRKELIKEVLTKNEVMKINYLMK